jgi:hypothetical protein
MQMMMEGSKSYWDWARSLTGVIGETVSKTAIFYRMNKEWVATVKALVREVVAQQASKKIERSLFAPFKNIWLQDSTSVQLPEVLFEKFRGKIMEGKKKSVAKLNIIVEALNGNCPLMEWDSFTVTEQSLAPTIMKVAEAGDLVIRDLGYFVLNIFSQMNAAGISFLSRWRYGVRLYDIQNGKEINLSKHLKGKSWIDIKVLCGREERLTVRLVAIKLPPEVANERRRKAMKDNHKTVNHSQEYLDLLDYVIFITNVGDEIWNYRQVATAYRIRWNIEILFKSWKSGFYIEEMIPEAIKHTDRIESILYLMLLYIAWFQMLVYEPMRWCLRQSGKYLSIIQLAKWIIPNTMKWINNKITKKMKTEILYFCKYDTRRRINAAQGLEQFFNSLT